MGRAGGSGGGGRSGGGRVGGGSSIGGGSFGGGRSGAGRSTLGGGAGRSGGGLFGGSSGSGSSGGGLFGGSSRSSSSGGGLFGGSSRGRSTGGGFFDDDYRREPRRKQTVIINNMNNNRFGTNDTYGDSTGRRINSNPGGGNSRVAGCLFAVVIFLAVILIVTALGKPPQSSDITASTIQREPLPAGSVVETAYYTDEVGWIGNETRLLLGMKNFYHATGVQPYLYITDNVNGAQISDVSELEAYAQELYPKLFTDEAHLLLIFYEFNGEYADYYLCGSQAKTVIDREAGDILLDYIDRYYYDNDMTDEEFFSVVFDKTATRIMTVEESPWPAAWMALAAAAIILILFLFWRERIKQKNRKAAQDAKILETPLERFGDPEVDELEKKYQD